MMWKEQFVIEWDAVTTELRKHKHLDRIRLTAKCPVKEDLRELIKKKYPKDTSDRIDSLALALGISRTLFNKKCGQPDRKFSEKQINVLVRLLKMTDEERARYF
jgi:hypothetical protein